MAEATEQLRIVISAQDQASQVMKSLGSEMNSFVSNMARGAAQGIGFAAFNQAAQAIGQAFDVAKESIVGFNSSLEQSRIAWATMLGGAGQAEAMLKQLQDFAQATPFTFPQVDQAARRFVAMGFSAQQVIPIMRSVAEAAQAVGGGSDAVNRISLALGQMSTRTRVSAQDMLQLTEVGVPAWRILAEATGMSIAQVQDSAEKGQISADTMISAFQRFADLHWASLLDVNTFQAAVSNIQDASQRLLAQAFRPLFEGLRDFALKAFDFLKSEPVAQFAQNVSNAQVAVAAFLQTCVQSEPILKTLAGALGGVAAVLGVALVVAIGGAVAAFLAANAALIALAAAAAAAGVVIAANWDDISQATSELAKNIGSVLSDLVDFVGQALNALTTEWTTGWQNLGNLATEAVNSVGKAWNEFWSIFGTTGQQAFQALVNLATDGFSKFADVAGAALTFVLERWNDFIGVITKANEVLPGVFSGTLLDPLVGKFVNVAEAGKTVRDAIANIPTAVGNAFSAVGTFTHDVVPTVIGRAVDMVQAAGGTIADLIPQIQEILAKGLPDLTQGGLDAGKAVGTAFGTGVVQAAKPLVEELARMLAQLRQAPIQAALEDTQFAIERDKLILQIRGMPAEVRTAARQEIRELSRNVLPSEELANLLAGHDVTIAQRAENLLNLRNQIGQTTLALAQQGGAPTAIAPASLTTTPPVAAPTTTAPGPAPTVVDLRIEVSTDGGSPQVFEQLIEANGQAVMPPVIQVSAVRRN